MIIGRFGIVGYLNVNPKFDIWAKRDYYQVDLDSDDGEFTGYTLPDYLIYKED